MSNFFYFDQNNQKLGPVTEEQLKELAAQGAITAQTPMETDTGHKGVAGQIPGLFPASSKQVFCTNCGKPVAEQAVACMSCGSKPIGHKNFCRGCGTAVNPGQIVCLHCGAAVTGTSGAAATASPAPSKQVFCTNCGNPVAEQAVACMSCGCKPTGHKKFCRGCGIAINPGQVVCVKCGAALASGQLGNSSTGGNALSNPISKKLDTYFMVFWICAVTGLALYSLVLFCFVCYFWATGNELWGDEILIARMFAHLAGTIPGIGGAVFGCMLLHQLWKLIPEDIARTTPGKAIGFLFIPFYNFYWIFVALKGLGEDMNKTLRLYGTQYNVRENFGLISCVWFIGTFIPYLVNLILVNSRLPDLILGNLLLGNLITIGFWVFFILFLKSVKDGAIASLEQQGA